VLFNLVDFPLIFTVFYLTLGFLCLTLKSSGENTLLFLPFSNVSYSIPYVFICYSPKIPYLCIHGIGLSTCIIFQITAEELYLKNHFLEHVRALLHYFPRTYTCCMLDKPRTYASCILNNPRLPPKVAKNKKLQGIQWSLRAIGGFPTNSPAIAHPQTK
jgi:hypothetical protein